MELVWPAAERLDSYRAALERGWSPDNMHGEVARLELLEKIRIDAAKFLRELVDPDGVGPRITLPDGSTVERLPGYQRWIWDGEFCGSIDLRWQRGTEELPPTCPGHIGYAVVPWKQGRGYATQALRELLPDACARGLARVEITTDLDNMASQRVIQKNGGVLIERFTRLASLGGGDSLRFRIDLA